MVDLRVALEDPLRFFWVTSFFSDRNHRLVAEFAKLAIIPPLSVNLISNSTKLRARSSAG